jgi:hypothetical protein
MLQPPLLVVIDQQRQIGPYEETKWSREFEKKCHRHSSAAAAAAPENNLPSAHLACGLGYLAAATAFKISIMQ